MISVESNDRKKKKKKMNYERKIEKNWITKSP